MERESLDFKTRREQKKAIPAAGGPIRNNDKGLVTPKPYTQNNQLPPQTHQHWKSSNQEQGKNHDQGGRCYHCNQEGHFKFACPQLNGSGSPKNGGQQALATSIGFGNQEVGQKQPRSGWNQQQPLSQNQNFGTGNGPAKPSQ